MDTMTIEDMGRFIATAVNDGTPDYETTRDDLSIKHPPPAIVLANGKGQPLVTMGNISLVTGKAKSRKSAFTTMLAGLHLNPTTPKVAPCTYKAELLASGRQGVLWLDTEQGKYHVHQTHRRIAYLANLSTTNNHDCLRVYSLREYSTIERLTIVEQAISDHAHTHPIIVIDGIRDLIADINEPSTSSDLVNSLLKWSSQYDCHIFCVMHENKGSDQVRGHLGTEAVNKAELVIRVAKAENLPNDVVCIEAVQARNASPEEMFISSDYAPLADGQLWIPVVENEVARSVHKKRKADFGNISDEELLEIVNKAFAGGTKIPYAAFLDRAKNELGKLQGVEVSRRDGETMIDLLVSGKFIECVGKTKSKSVIKGSAAISTTIPTTPLVAEAEEPATLWETKS